MSKYKEPTYKRVTTESVVVGLCNLDNEVGERLISKGSHYNIIQMVRVKDREITCITVEADNSTFVSVTPLLAQGHIKYRTLKVGGHLYPP